MILQQTDSLGRINIMGVGRIVCKPDSMPVIFNKVSESKYKMAKASFTVLTGVKKAPDYSEDNKKYIYQAIPCALYGRQYNKDLYAKVESLQANDRVRFYGVCFVKKAKDSKTGKEINYTEVSIEDLEIISRRFAKTENTPDLRTEKEVEKAVDAANNKQNRESEYDF